METRRAMEATVRAPTVSLQDGRRAAARRSRLGPSQRAVGHKGLMAVSTPKLDVVPLERGVARVGTTWPVAFRKDPRSVTLSARYAITWTCEIVGKLGRILDEY